MPSNPGSSPDRKRRVRSKEAPNVGNTRYELIRAAATQARRALEEGFYLEAVTLLESLMAERLEKRAQWLAQCNRDASLHKMFAKVEDGFANLGDLIPVIKKAETDVSLLADVEAVDTWRKRRNAAIHQMAKFGTGGTAASNWGQRLDDSRLVATDGAALLLSLDLHERASAHAGRNKRHASATCPNALAPLGQRTCEWCEQFSEADLSSSPKPPNER